MAEIKTIPFPLLRGDFRLQVHAIKFTISQEDDIASFGNQRLYLLQQGQMALLQPKRLAEGFLANLRPRCRVASRM